MQESFCLYGCWLLRTGLLKFSVLCRIHGKVVEMSGGFSVLLSGYSAIGGAKC
jgi:hypothetical protein